MLLSELLPESRAQLRVDPKITGVSEDSHRIQQGMVFVAIRGSSEDGHAYVSDALARGAFAIVAERPVPVPAGVALVVVPSSRAALAGMAARFYGHPARELTVIGFTGTFGKTSTSDVLRRLLDASGRHAGVLGSFGATYGAFHQPDRGLTTPAPVELHAALRGLVQAGADTVIMEVTSHALAMERVAGLKFGGGLLAAIMPGEHTDFHRSYEEYVAAKRLFLAYLSPDAILAYDADNEAARRLACEARVARTVGFSLDGRPADFVFADVRLDGTGASFTVNGRPMRSALLGRGHVRNVALAFTYALTAGVEPEAAADVLNSLTPHRRRMERYEAAGRQILDDTAGHPESLRATFEVASLVPHRRLVLAYAIRGNRGPDINRRNAEALVDMAARAGASQLIVSASAEIAGPHDRVAPEERSATLAALASGGSGWVFHEKLEDALRAAIAASAPDDLIVLLGSQGMDHAKRLLRALDSAGISRRTAPTRTD
jgi:UDP-N-acetylmuramoyl-L-alanyl-D-glutamate--2,6-diaminopimelate ligase